MLLADATRQAPAAAAERVAAEQARTDRWGTLPRGARIVAADRDEIVARVSARAAVRERLQLGRVRARVPRSGARAAAGWLKGAAATASAIHGRIQSGEAVVGAEGTLASVTEAVVHLMPLPRGARRGGAAFRFAGGGGGATVAVLVMRPSAAELFDGQIIRLAEQSLEYRHYLDFVVGQPESLLLVEFSGETTKRSAHRPTRWQIALRGQPGFSISLGVLDAS